MARGFMANLSTPAFLVDRDGVLVFYNEAAEEIEATAFPVIGRSGLSGAIAIFWRSSQ